MFTENPQQRLPKPPGVNTYEQRTKGKRKKTYQDDESDIPEGYAYVEPKVMVPYLQLPGRLSRKQVMAETRKLYAQFQLEDLFEEEGIDYRNPKSDQACWLPLEPFDDIDYDIHEPDGWLSYSRSVGLPLRGRGLWRDPKDGVSFWRDVRIDHFQSEGDFYLGKYEGSDEKCKLHRLKLFLYVCIYTYIIYIYIYISIGRGPASVCAALCVGIPKANICRLSDQI